MKGLSNESNYVDKIAQAACERCGAENCFISVSQNFISVPFVHVSLTTQQLYFNLQQKTHVKLPIPGIISGNNFENYR